ncbi:MAG: alpha/beta hydrolase [Chitinophagaceae bacterium]|nr:alpha/beta hydrolase [Chitinophagaceae bacterium]
MKVIKNLQLAGAEGRIMLYDLHFYQNEQPKAVILYIHGFNGFKDWGNFDLIAEQFAMHGFFFVKMNLSHNGTTITQPEDFADLQAYSRNNYSKELDDTAKMITMICNPVSSFALEIDRERIILLGHSRGGGIAILQASLDVRVKAVITWASVAACKPPWGNWSVEKMKNWKDQGVDFIENKRTHQQMPLAYQLYEDFEQNAEKLNIKRALQHLKIPIQLCHGTADEAVPFSAFLQMQLWKADASFVVLDSNHVFDRKHPYTAPTLPAACLKVIGENIAFLKKNSF